VSEERERGTGIAKQFIGHNDRIIESSWNDAADRLWPVGTCRHNECAGKLMARPARRDGNPEGGILWFEASCNVCSGMVVAPNGRVMRKSTAHSDMPKNWLADRNRALAAEAAGRKEG